MAVLAAPVATAGGDEFLTAFEAARMVGVSRAHLRALLAADGISIAESSRHGFLVRRDLFDAWRRASRRVRDRAPGGQQAFGVKQQSHARRTKHGRPGGPRRRPGE